MKQNGMRERKGRISRYGRRMLAVLLSTGMLLTETLPVSGTENTEETARPHQLYCTVLGDSIAKGYTCDKSWMENYGSLAAKEIAYSEGCRYIYHNALMLYAIIYGFSQTTNTAFTGSVDYLCEWLGGVSRPTVINTLDNLVKQGLLTKSSTTKGALIYNSYTALRPSKKILSDEDPTSKKTLPDTSKNFLLNKDSKDNIEKSISKEMEGKAPKKKSYSTILEDPVNKFVKEALSKFIQYCRGKNYTPKVTTVEKFASTLRDNAGEDPVVALAIVDQSIDKGWKDLYPLKNYLLILPVATLQPLPP